MANLSGAPLKFGEPLSVRLSVRLTESERDIVDERPGRFIADLLRAEIAGIKIETRVNINAQQLLRQLGVELKSLEELARGPISVDLETCLIKVLKSHYVAAKDLALSIEPGATRGGTRSGRRRLGGSRWVGFRVTPTVNADLDRTAKIHGLTKSDIVRNAFRKGSIIPVADRVALAELMRQRGLVRRLEFMLRNRDSISPILRQKLKDVAVAWAPVESRARAVYFQKSGEQE